MLSSAEVNGHALMVCLGRMVKQIAQQVSLVALTTNHLVGGGSALHTVKFTVLLKGIVPTKHYILLHACAEMLTADLSKEVLSRQAEGMSSIMHIVSGALG